MGDGLDDRVYRMVCAWLENVGEDPGEGLGSDDRLS
jgi:hypothetical protein